MELTRRVLRRLGYSGWLLVSAVLAIIAGAGLVGAVSESSYSEENRSPEARIVIAAIAFSVASVALAVAIRHLRGKPGRLGLVRGLSLNVLTMLLIFLLIVVSLLSGPL